jgi:hypothetical protein
MEVTGELISQHERRAMMAERETMDRYVAAYLSEQVGALVDCRITGVQPFGFFATVVGLGGDGLVPVSTLGSEYFHYQEASQSLVGEDSGERFEPGQLLQLRLAEPTRSAARSASNSPTSPPAPPATTASAGSARAPTAARAATASRAAAAAPAISGHQRPQSASAPTAPPLWARSHATWAIPRKDRQPMTLNRCFPALGRLPRLVRRCPRQPKDLTLDAAPATGRRQINGVPVASRRPETSASSSSTARPPRIKLRRSMIGARHDRPVR